MTQRDVRARAKELVAQYGSQSAAARAIVSECVIGNGTIPTFNAVRMWINAALLDTSQSARAEKEDRLTRIAELLEKNGIAIADVGEIKKIRLGTHQGFIKNKDGEVEYTKDLAADTIVFTPAWETGPAWPVVQPAAPTKITYAPYVARPRIGKTIVIMPDVQCGFLRNIDNPSQLTPIHDRAALDVAAQIVADLQPDQIGWIGDFVDLPEMSRWLQVEEFWRTTQPGINEAHKILAEFECAAGPRREATFFIAGNHDRRLREYALKNARAAFHLRPAMSTPQSWPDLTIPHLLRLDELGIEYCGEYPGSEKWLTKDLVCRHNPPKKYDYAGTVIAGHTHHVRNTVESRRSQGGSIFSRVVEIGCLCRIDNYDDRNSLMATSVPSDRGYVTGWTQAVCVVHIDEDEQFQIETVEIQQKDGVYKAGYAGRWYSAKREAA